MYYFVGTIISFALEYWFTQPFETRLCK